MEWLSGQPTLRVEEIPPYLKDELWSFILAFQSRLEKKARAADVPDPSFRQNISTILNQIGEIDQKVTELKAENEELKAKLNEGKWVNELRTILSHATSFCTTL